MQETLEKMEGLQRKLSFAVPRKNIEEGVEERLKKLSSTVRLSGFRPGKVPLQVVRQRYGEEVRREVFRDLVEKALTDALESRDLKMLGIPALETQENEEAVEVSATFEEYPEISFSDPSAWKVKKPVVTVSEEDVLRTLDAMRRQHAHPHPKEGGAEEGDVMEFDIETKDGEEPVQALSGQGKSLVLGEGPLGRAFAPFFLGMGPGEEKTGEVSLGEDVPEPLKNKTLLVSAKVRAVKSVHVPELDEDFARHLGVEGGSVEKLKDDVRLALEREMKKKLHARLVREAESVIAEAASMEMPEGLVRQEGQEMIRFFLTQWDKMGKNPEEMPMNEEGFLAQAREVVKKRLALREFIAKNELWASPEEVRAEVEEAAEEYEDPQAFAHWCEEDPQRLKAFEEAAVEKKLVRWLLDHALLEEEPMELVSLLGEKA